MLSSDACFKSVSFIFSPPVITVLPITERLWPQTALQVSLISCVSLMKEKLEILNSILYFYESYLNLYC